MINYIHKEQKYRCKNELHSSQMFAIMLCNLGKLVGMYWKECVECLFPRNLTKEELLSQNNNE